MGYKATIAIPCYNKEDYLRRSLDSIVAQSRFNDFEVIIVDDCSTDASAQIIEQYVKRYDNFTLVKFDRSSGGPSKPRNTAIQLSTTGYIIFMDPDDEIINDGYSTLLTKMEEYQSDILIAARIGVTQEGATEFTDFIDERFTYINENTDAIRRDLLYRRPFILKTIYKKSLIVENGICFNERICTSEDEAFDIRCVAHAERITKINDIVYKYTVESNDSITTRVGLRIYEELYDILVELNDAYRLVFSEEIANDRLMELISVFYIQRLSFMEKPEDILQGCGCIYESFERFGFEKLSVLHDKDKMDVLTAIRNKDISFYVYDYLLKRIQLLNRRNGAVCQDLEGVRNALDTANKSAASTEKRAKKAERKLAAAEKDLHLARKMLNRKIVRPGVLFAKAIDAVVKKK